MSDRPFTHALRPVRGSGVLVGLRWLLVVVASLPAWLVARSSVASGPAKMPYFTDVEGVLPFIRFTRTFRELDGGFLVGVAAGAVLAVLVSLVLSAAALGLFDPARPAKGLADVLFGGARAARRHLGAFVRVLLFELVFIGLGIAAVVAVVGRIELHGKRVGWTGYALIVLLPVAKIYAIVLWVALVGAWGIAARALTVADDRRRVRRTGLLVLSVWRRAPLRGPVLYVVATVLAALGSGALLVAWRQAPPEGGAVLRVLGWLAVLALHAGLWHWLLRGTRLLVESERLSAVRARADSKLDFGPARTWFRRRLRTVGLAAALVLATGAGCKKAPPPASSPPAASPAAVPAAKTVRPAPVPRAPAKPPAAIEKLCSRCHVFPPPDSLARLAWPAEVKAMLDVAGIGADGVDGVSARDIAMWFGDAAPIAHRHYLGPASPRPGPVTWVPRERNVTNPGQLPGVANVNLARLTKDGPLEVIFAEMRSGWIARFDPSNPQLGFRPIGKARNPAGTQVVDLDADGHLDVLVADMGVFYPSNDRNGAVHWWRGTRNGKFETQTILDNVGRVTDVEAADLDGDGDLDIAVAVFGWRAVGEVLVLENQGGRGKRTVFVPRRVIERTGAIHLHVSDVDGDGKPDLTVLFAQEHEQVSVFLTRPGWTFEEKVAWKAPHPAWGMSGMQVVDLDGDGDDDVLVTNGDTLDLSGDEEVGKAGPEHLLFPYHGVRWLERVGPTEWKLRELAPMYGVHRAQAGDLDGDGDMDVVAAAYMPLAPDESVRKAFQTEALIWLEQTDKGVFLRHTLRMRDVEIPTLDLGDWDGDGDLDLVTGHLFLARLRPGQRDVSITLWENRGRPAASGLQ